MLIFDASPSRSELYLLNCFRLKKRGEIAKPIKSKFVSRGVHLGRGILELTKV